MPDLSSVIAFNAVLDRSGSMPVIRVYDVSVYPGGVAPTIKGNLSITQPDGITVANTNFSSPDIQWNGSSLPPAIYELRLNTANSFQTGGYSITYTVQATGYSQTALTKTFTLAYTKPVAVIGENFDIFTPTLTVTDQTNYAQSTLTLITTADTWTGIITSVGGTPQSIGGTGLTFDLNYSGSYYDANYAITLSAIPTWTITANNWVTIIDIITITQSFDSEIPPSVTSLLSSLDFLKTQLDASICNCNLYPTLLANYLLAETTYSHFRFRGCASDFAGLIIYVQQLQAIFNNGQAPAIVHTNTIIPAYNFGCGGAGSIAWSSITGKPSVTIIEWTVGQAGFPVAGQNTLTDARLAGYQVLILRNSIQELNFTKLLASSTITFTNAFTTGEVLYVQTYPI